MAEHAAEEPKGESLMEKIAEKIHGHSSSSSSSDSDDEKKSGPSAASKAKIWRLFGREQPVHQVLGGGMPADVFLWRNKKVSAGVLGAVTAVWVVFELFEYHLLTLVCHFLILSLTVLFIWSNATTFIKKSRPHIPQVSIPEDLAVNIALSLRYEINRSFAVLREIVSRRELKKLFIVFAGLWLFSVLGNSCNFLTLFYLTFVLLHAVPLLYEKYEDKVDSFAEKMTIEFKRHYAVVHEKYLSKIPKRPLKDKKHQ